MMPLPKPKRFRRRQAVIRAAAAAAGMPLVCFAAGPTSFTGSSGQDWNTATHWSAGAVPGTGDTVTITEVPILTSFSVVYDSNYTAATAIGSLTLDGGRALGPVLSQTTTGDNLFSGGETVGNNGVAQFTQSAATNSMTGSLLLGNNANGQGTYLLSGTGTLSAPTIDIGVLGHGTINLSGGTLAATNEFVGASGTGSVSQSGGSHTVATLLSIGDQAGATGNYTLSSGLLTASAAEYVGNFGTGVFTQTGGTHTLPSAIGALWIGLNPGGNGTYSLGSTGTLAIVNNLEVGASGKGTFIQSGGSTSAGNIYLGNADGGSGIYQLSAGTLTAGAGYIAKSDLGTVGGTGSLVQSGGTANFSSLILANGAHDTGTYSLAAGGSLSVSGSESVGYSGAGTFIQSGGTHTAGNLFVATNFGSSGNYSMAGGTLSIGQLGIGYSGVGTFNQTGGTVSINNGNILFLGGFNGIGAYNLSAGTLTGAFYEAVGYDGVGSFVQSGGTNTIFGGLFLGYYHGNLGSYSLSGSGTLNLGSFQLGVGNQGSGTFTQSGGTLTSGSIVVASSSGSSGLYQLSGGSISAVALTVGSSGPASGLGGAVGSFVQTGGSASFNNDLSLGLNAGAVGSCSISSGLLYFYGFGGVGGTWNTPGGTGVLAISGGTVYVANQFSVWNTPGTSVTLSGGSLIAGTLFIDGNPALFNWTGGTLRLGGGNYPVTTIDSNFALGPSITLTPGKTLEGNATLVNNGQLVLAGGTVMALGPLINGTGQITGFGSIWGNGGFTNTGNITQSGGALTLSDTGANYNYGNIDLAVGNQFQLTGGNLLNAGTINLNGATINGSAQLNNGATGILSGRGTISAALTNAGTIVLSDGTLTLPSFTNTGSVVLNGPAANLSGSAITNLGYIQGSGNVNTSITNNGTIQPTGNATLRLTQSVTNSGAGLLTATTGNQLLLMQGLANNAGSISLTGGTIDTNNTTATNSGTISGYGILRTGGLTNNSQITLAGGAATIGGPFTNASGGTVNVRYVPAIFTGPVTNNAGGIFKITGGSATFVGSFTNNGAYNSDPADNYFADLNISTTGSLQGGAGDRFFISGDLLSSSVENRDWQTASSLVALQGARLHRLSITGTDEGPDAAGYINNFAVGTLELEAGGSLALLPATPHSALYVDMLQLAGGIDQIGSILGNGATIYYDSINPANAYLAGQTYALEGGGEIAPVPEPATAAVLVLGAMLLRRRDHRSRKTNGVAINAAESTMSRIVLATKYGTTIKPTPTRIGTNSLIDLPYMR